MNWKVTTRTLTTGSSLFTIYCLLFTALSACTKTEAVSDVPSIEFVSITPNPAVRYMDSVVITLNYEDGNGDLGENTSGVTNAFITDSRNNITTPLRISQLAPDGADIHIRGSLRVVLNPLSLVDDNNPSESASFSIYLTDRAGNQSNTVQTSAITVNAQ